MSQDLTVRPNDVVAAAALDGALRASQLARASASECLEHLGVTHQGLTESEARARLVRFGLNVLPRPKRTPWYLELLANFIHLFAVLLWVAAGLAWAGGMPELAVAIVIVVLINGVFSYWQQYRAEQAIEALESLLPQSVTVRREGSQHVVPATQVAIGDLIVLTQGDAIPVDARLVTANRLRVDLSSLSGESRPVTRYAEQTAQDPRTLPEQPNLVLAGTTVAAGQAEAVVFATGAQTEFGRLAQLTHAQPRHVSTLEREMIRITRLITVLAVGMGFIFFALGSGIAHLSVLEGFLFALGIIVANVPEGLLPELSLTLAAGARRMAARNAIVKRLERVETLGAVTVVVTDKTGTLTENEMTVRQIWLPDGSWRIEGNGYEPRGEVTSENDVPQRREDVERLLRCGALCCDAQLKAPVGGKHHWTAIGDPTEAAIVAAAAKCGLDAERLGRFSRLAELPFDSVRKRMTTIQGDGAAAFACVKGAAEEILSLSTTLMKCGALQSLNKSDLSSIEDAVRRMTGSGLRVLAVATRPVARRDATGGGYHLDNLEQDLTFLGLLGMEDPPRPEVPRAVAACREAGIRVIMATGDDGRTAEAIGGEIGMCSATPRVIKGAELDRFTDLELAVVLGDPNILFARVAPEHKLRLVEALQRRGEVVAVTGDGVNDAPALKRADIGVAMGECGTDVARQAADIILTDDNFATIVAAIEEGRAVYDNVRKFITYVFASNIPEIIPFISFVLWRIPLPLTVMQMLAVDLGTDLFPALALGAEPPEPGVMRRPPRPRSQRLLDGATLTRAYLWLGMIEAALCMTGYFATYLLAGWRPGMPLAASGSIYVLATTMSLAGIVFCQFGNALACRSNRESIFRLGLFTNKFLLLGIIAEALILLALIYTPPLASMFHLIPPACEHWLVLAPFGLIVLGCEELRKWFARHRSREANIQALPKATLHNSAVANGSPASTCVVSDRS